MRDIKFRAWNKSENKMMYGYQATSNPTFTRSFNYRSSEIELMQYTEIKDKNNVEIYEGDIVKIAIKPCTEGMTEVEFYTGEVYFDNGYRIKTEDYCPSLTHYHKLWIEKVGNRYGTTD